MPSESDTERALLLLRVADYLMVQADKRGLTHGEKHHFMFTAIAQLREARHILGDNRLSFLTHNDESDLEKGDIPF